MDIDIKKGRQFNLDEFVELLIRAKGYQNLTENSFRELRKDLIEKLSNRIITEIINYVPVDKLFEVEKLVYKKDVDGIVQFMDNNISNTEQIIIQVLLDFKRLYIGK